MPSSTKIFPSHSHQSHRHKKNNLLFCLAKKISGLQQLCLASSAFPRQNQQTSAASALIMQPYANASSCMCNLYIHIKAELAAGDSSVTLYSQVLGTGVLPFIKRRILKSMWKALHSCSLKHDCRITFGNNGFTEMLCPGDAVPTPWYD